jgi:hypothetical protein
MPFHIKSTSNYDGIVVKDVYYVSEGHWTETYEDRKIFSSKSSATTAKNKKVTSIHGVQYVNAKLNNSTIVSE